METIQAGFGRCLCARSQVVSQPALFQNLVLLGDFLPALSAAPEQALLSVSHRTSERRGSPAITEVVEHPHFTSAVG